jgi:tripartite-type tricarboxylate transporter receptor subunit TctC
MLALKLGILQDMFSARLFVLSILTFALGTPCTAAWPEKPITIIVGAAPGGTGDQAARIISEKLGAELGTTVVVENKAGAGGILGSQYVARATPDGYTLMMANIGSHSINYSLYKKLPYTPEDFSAITLVISNPNILVVNSSTPFTTVQELVAAIKKDPGHYSFGSAGAGQSPHLSGEMFMQRTGIQVPHIPYKGAGPATGALLGNQFTFMIATAPSVMAQIKGGRLRALAVTSEVRTPELPNVPTMAEAGVPNMLVTAWFGLFAPAATPSAIVDRLQQATAKVLSTADIQNRFKEMGGITGGNSPAEFNAFVRSEIANWKQTVEAANLSQE